MLTTGRVGTAWYGYGVYSRAVNAFSATRLGSWLVATWRRGSTPPVPVVAGARATVTGVPTLPMLVLTTTGRRSGMPRAVQLAHVAEPAGTLARRRERHGAATGIPTGCSTCAPSPGPCAAPRPRHGGLASGLDRVEATRRWPDIERHPADAHLRAAHGREIPVVRLAAR